MAIDRAAEADERHGQIQGELTEFQTMTVAELTTGLIGQSEAIELCGDERLLAGIVAAGLVERSKIRGAIYYSRRDLERVLQDDLDMRAAKRLAATAKPLPAAPAMPADVKPYKDDVETMQRCASPKMVMLTDLGAAPAVPAATAARLERMLAMLPAPRRIAFLEVLQRGLDATADVLFVEPWTRAEREHLAVAARDEAARQADVDRRDREERDGHEQREQRRQRIAQARAAHPDAAMRAKMWNATGPAMRAERFCEVCGSVATEARWQTAPPGTDPAAWNRQRDAVRLQCQCGHRFAMARLACVPGDVPPASDAPRFGVPADQRGELLSLGELATTYGVPVPTLESHGRGGAFELVKVRGELHAYAGEVQGWITRAGVTPERKRRK